MATGSSQPFSRQSRSNRHKYRDPFQSELQYDGRCEFSSSLLPGLQKVGKNKTFGQQYVWGQDPVNRSNKQHCQSFQRRKNYWNDKKGRCHRCCCRCRRLKNPAAKLSMQHTSKRLWLHPSQKGSGCHARMWFCNGTKNQSAPPPQSGTFKPNPDSWGLLWLPKASNRYNSTMP